MPHSSDNSFDFGDNDIELFATLSLEVPNVLEEETARKFTGSWHPISSSNLPAYFKAQKMSEISEIAWEHGIVHYEFQLPLVRTYSTVFDKVFNECISKIGKVVENRVVRIMGNGRLDTICIDKNGKLMWKVEREVFDNGKKLRIQNTFRDVKCERIYEKN